MIPIVIPTTDVNSETCIIVAWHAEDGDFVLRDQLVVEAETSKAVIEIHAPAEGFLLREWPEGGEVPLGEVVARLFSDSAALETCRVERSRHVPEAPASPGDGVSATRRAVELAKEAGIDLSTLGIKGLVTAEDVERAILNQKTMAIGGLPDPLQGLPGVKRVLVIGGGSGATQIIDIYAYREDFQVVAIVDDDAAKWGEVSGGVPVIGGTDRMRELFEERVFDAAIISIGTSVAVRSRFRKTCEKLGVPLANAIHPTVSIATQVKMGRGNVVCAFCHLGVGALVGDNNFLSAYNSFDHHCVLASDISTGPGCMASGRVRIGDRVRMGTGVFIEPNLEIGDDVRIASGVAIMQSVPANHTVKVKTGQFAVVRDRTSANF